MSVVLPEPPDEVVLRSYQQQAQQATLAARDRGLRRALLVMPTGCGKTTVFASLIGAWAGEGKRPQVLVLAHRTELLDQGAERIRQQNPDLIVEIESGDVHASDRADVVVAGVQSVGRPRTKRLDWMKPDLVICDEAHHAPADSYQNVFRRMGCYDGETFLLGVTATPHRLDNRPLHGHESAIFEDIVYTYTLRNAINDGWLCDLRGYRVGSGISLRDVKTVAGDFNQGMLAKRVNVEARNNQALRSWGKVGRDRRTIVFCVTVEHAKDVAQMFRSAGVSAEHVDGTMDMEQRAGILERFRSGETQVLANVEIAVEGFDLPEIACVLMLRPTQSWALYTQMIGRGLRILEDKSDCIVIDVVDNFEKVNLASVASVFGLPSDIDLQGNKITKAVEKFETLNETEKGALFKRPTTYDHISDVLTAVDLIAELQIPDEVLRLSRFSWLKIGDGQYYLSCGSSEEEKNREARLTCDTLGTWRLEVKSDKRQEVYDDFQGLEMYHAFKRADARLRGLFPKLGAIAAQEAEWKSKAATPKQIAALQRFSVDEETIKRLNAGQASLMIGRLISEARDKSRNPA